MFQEEICRPLYIQTVVHCLIYLQCLKILQQKSDLALNKSLSEHKDVFKDELRTLKDVQITILVDPTIKPKYYRAHPVPYTLTVMQFKKQLINDRLRVSDISSKFRILTTYYYAVIFS